MESDEFPPLPEDFWQKYIRPLECLPKGETWYHLIEPKGGAPWLEAWHRVKKCNWPRTEGGKP